MGVYLKLQHLWGVVGFTNQKILLKLELTYLNKSYLISYLSIYFFIFLN